MTKCFYYWVLDHYLKRHYSIFQRNFNNNRIYLGDDKRVCIGLYTLGAWLVNMQKKKSGRESIVDAKKWRYPTLPITKVKILRIDKLSSDLYSSNEEDKFISLDVPLDISIFSTCSRQDKNSTSALIKKLIKQILYKRIEKENSYATPKNVRFRE